MITMKINLRRWASGLGLLSVLGLLVGAGVQASYLDSGSATVNQSVGTFSCTLSTTYPNSVISPDGHTVTMNMPTILSSAAGTSYADLTVRNSGTIPAVVHWTIVTGGSIAWLPAGRMGYVAGTVADPMSTDLTLASGASHTYSTTGFQWNVLTNADIGQTASVAYTANCGEVPAIPQSKISFVGAANEATPHTYSGTVKVPTDVTGWAGTGSLSVSAQNFLIGSPVYFSVPTSGVSPATLKCTASNTSLFSGCTTLSGSGTVAAAAPFAFTSPAPMTLPAAAQAGDLAIVMNTSNSAPGPVPVGYTALYTAVGTGQTLSYRFLTAGETVVPIFGNAGSSGAEVAVYRGVSAVGATKWNNGYGMSTIAFGPLTLTKTNGTSWVVGMANDDQVTSNKLWTTSFSPAGLTARNAGLSYNRDGLWDTNGGVSSPSPAFSGNDGNFGYSGYFALELESK